MTDLTRDDIHDDLAPEERRRRQRKMLPKRLLRLLLLLAGIVIVVVVIVLVARSAVSSGQAADYQRYMSSISNMLKQSDSIGGELVKLLTNPETTTRKSLQTDLDQYISTSEQLEAQAKAMDVPKDLVSQDVHQFFVLVMTFRYKGLVDLKPSLMNALEVQEVEVSSVPITRALQYLANSDFLYKEVFAPRATEILKAKNLTGVTVPSTSFLTDTDLASKSRVQEVLSALKSTGNLQAVHGVAVAKVVASPDDKEILAGNTYNLTSSDQLAFLVTVENQGNMSEKDVPVVVTLLPPDSTTPQKKTVSIQELKPKEEKTVTVSGLNPTAYGEAAVLKVEVGPVNDEKFKDNNSLEATVIFTL
ncbi:MAG: hypothetical protein M1274_15025 [Actinobacteria bacterium]|nr:hypothetical protein [Actinomycetota bacterium]